MADRAIVHTNVSLGTPNELPGFGLAVDIKVEGVDDEVLKAGHEVCISTLTNNTVRLTERPSSAHTAVP